MTYQDGFSGDLEQVDLRDLLRSLCEAGAGGVVAVRHSPFLTTIWLKGGELVDAQSGDLTGVDAMYAALALDHGAVEFTAPAIPRSRTIFQSVDEVIGDHELIEQWVAEQESAAEAAAAAEQDSAGRPNEGDPAEPDAGESSALEVQDGEMQPDEASSAELEAGAMPAEAPAQPVAPRDSSPQMMLPAASGGSTPQLMLPPASSEEHQDMEANAASPEVAPVTPPSEDDAASMLGRYKIVDRIGRGGMGTVYRAHLIGDSGFVRPVAIKVLRTEHSRSHTALKMLLKEAHIASRLQHRNVVSVIDVGSVDGQPYLVMDYIEGQSLATLLQQTPREVSTERIVAVILDALTGLHAIHNLSTPTGKRLGVVHNDLSPENIIVGIDGTARVSDLGVASLRRDTEAGRRGKAPYVSPERIRGRSFDQRSDVFSMGVVMWNALTGVDLYQGDSVSDIMRNVLTQPVPRPSTVGRRPPPILDDVCLRALARDPYSRFRDAEEMLIALRRVAIANDLLAAPSSVSAWVSLLGPPSVRAAGRLPSPLPPAYRPASMDDEEGLAAPLPPPDPLPTPRLPDWEPAALGADSVGPHFSDTQRLQSLGSKSTGRQVAQALAAFCGLGVLAYAAVQTRSVEMPADDESGTTQSASTQPTPAGAAPVDGNDTLLASESAEPVAAPREAYERRAATKERPGEARRSPKHAAVVERAPRPSSSASAAPVVPLAPIAAPTAPPIAAPILAPVVSPLTTPSAAPRDMAAATPSASATPPAPAPTATTPPIAPVQSPTVPGGEGAADAPRQP